VSSADVEGHDTGDEDRRPIFIGPWCDRCGDAFDGPERQCPKPAPGRPYVDCGRGGHMFGMEREPLRDLPTVEQVDEYLRRGSWRLRGSAGEWAVWSRDGDEEEDALDVPIGMPARTFYWHAFIGDLSRAEARSLDVIVSEMLTTPLDAP
jgi:hypothetical protein